MSWMEEDPMMCIPGLGENKQKPHSGRPESASSERISGKRCANRGGAGDSSQMSSLIWQPITPTEPVQEEPFVAVDAGGKVEATPFFTSASSTILIRGGSVVNAEDEEARECDVLVENGVITRVEADIEVPEGATVINASGKYVLPGGIDSSTRLVQGVSSAQLADDLESSSRAALAGGTTTLVDLVLPERGESLTDAVEMWKVKVDETSCCDVVLSVGVPEVSEERKADMEKLTKDMGVNTYKLFLSYKDRFMLEDDELLDVLKHIKRLGGVAQIHPENGSVVERNTRNLVRRGVTGPEGHPLAHAQEVEEEAVRRICTLALQVNVPICISGVTCPESVEIIAEFKAKGLEVVGEPAAAALGADGAHYYNKCWDHAAGFICSPPLRAGKGVAGQLVEGLVEGNLDMVASHNCTYTKETKQVGRDNFAQIPEGTNGVEERMSVVYTTCVSGGKMPLPRFVEVTSTAAAKFLNIYPRKGCIAEGSDADIVVWDPAHTATLASSTHQYQTNFNIFQGMEVEGGAEFVLANGKIAVAEFQLNAIPGSGSLVSAEPFPSMYERIRDKDRLVKLVPVARDDVPKEEERTAEPDTFGMTTPRGYFQGQVLNKDLGIFQRPLSAHGVRNQQDSTFSLTGGYQSRETHSAKARMTAVKIQAPPGGSSDNFW